MTTYHPSNCCGKPLPGIRRWCSDNPTCLVLKKAAQRARTVKASRERRKKFGYGKKPTENPCTNLIAGKQCGKDKGANRQVCNACLAAREDAWGVTIYMGGSSNPSDLRWTPLPDTVYPMRGG